MDHPACVAGDHCYQGTDRLAALTLGGTTGIIMRVASRQQPVRTKAPKSDGHRHRITETLPLIPDTPKDSLRNVLTGKRKKRRRLLEDYEERQSPRRAQQ